MRHQTKRTSGPVSKAAKKNLRIRLKSPKPRGVPFSKGHEIGAAFRFKKGQSGNPDGRPKSKEIGNALRNALKAETPPATRTYAEKLVATWIKKGLKGSEGAIAAMANRAEGMPFASIGLDSGPDKLTLLLEAMTERHTERFVGVVVPALDVSTQQEDSPQ